MDSRYAEKHDESFHKLLAFLAGVPAVETNDTPSAGFGSGRVADGRWWVKFTLDIEHESAWSVVQEMGHVLNYVSIEQQVPAVFKPVSPPPYMNGGPGDFLSWVIESTDANFTPEMAGEWLQGRMPDPVDDPDQWPVNQD